MPPFQGFEALENLRYGASMHCLRNSVLSNTALHSLTSSPAEAFSVDGPLLEAIGVGGLLPSPFFHYPGV
ncbi:MULTISPECIES: hypothetical protein [unclassified Imperialibacter]|uniref:hypothetical protein n=1 Tax=unclassified Imperialibacter TaxID=2629706 RepID=UPI00125F05B6|nr:MULTISPECIES: hypothetical protein [unclassified Imperialibacter]